jgi:hypothetical protein
MSRTLRDIVNNLNGAFYDYEDYKGGVLTDNVSQFLSWSYLRPHNGGVLPADDGKNVVFISSYCGYSDYGGSSVEACNKAHILRVAEDAGLVGGSVWEVYGDYNSHDLAFSIDLTDEDILEALEALEDYPCVDDEELGQLEIDGQDESWGNWAKHDFIRELEKFFEIEFDHTDDDEIYMLFQEGCDKSNTYWQEEGGYANWTIDLERIVEDGISAEMMSRRFTKTTYSSR